MNCDLVRCKNCQQSFVFRFSGQTQKDPLILSCPQCKHVYTYAAAEQTSDHTPFGEPDYGGKSPTVFSVVLACESDDCCDNVTVVAPRKAGTTYDDLETEFPTWKMHDLQCSSRHPVTQARRKRKKEMDE